MTSIDEYPGTIIKGVMVGFALQLFLLLMPILAIGIAIVQLVYIIPAVLHYRSENEHNTVKGLWIAAAVVALLNATCWALVLGGGMKLGG